MWGFRLFRFRSPLLAKCSPTLGRDCFLFLALLRCFSSDGTLYHSYVSCTAGTNCGNDKFQINTNLHKYPIGNWYLLVFIGIYWKLFCQFQFMHTMQDTFAMAWPSINSVEFPHSDTGGSQDRGSFPPIIAALRVLHR